MDVSPLHPPRRGSVVSRCAGAECTCARGPSCPCSGWVVPPRNNRLASSSPCSPFTTTLHPLTSTLTLTHPVNLLTLTPFPLPLPLSLSLTPSSSPARGGVVARWSTSPPYSASLPARDPGYTDALSDTHTHTHTHRERERERERERQTYTDAHTHK